MAARLLGSLVIMQYILMCELDTSIWYLLGLSISLLVEFNAPV